MTPKEAIKFMKDQKAVAIDFKFNDFLGIWQHFTVPPSEMEEAVFDEGLGFDGSSIRGWQPIHASDMLVVPDPTTAVMDPFCEQPTLSLICNIVDPITKEDYSRDPRNIARKAEAYLKSTGLADTAYFGPEAEFYIFDSVRFDQNQFSGYYFLDSIEGVWNSGRERELDGSPNLAYKPRYRRATSRSRRWTSSRTFGRRWCAYSSRSGSTSKCSTTKSVPPARPRSTCASTRSCAWPTS